MKKQVALIILDGWGHTENSANNAIFEAKTPNFDFFWNKYPHAFLKASEEYVGLPKGQPGNSEIGHTTIGAGKIIDTDLVRIKKDIDSGNFYKNQSFKKVFNHVNQNQSTLHIFTLLGEGGVHAHEDHLLALLEFVKKENLKKVALHLFTDGRDSGPYDSRLAFEKLEKVLTPEIFISTISGRYYAMDRDNNWDRLEKFWQLIESQENYFEHEDFQREIQRQYDSGLSDEHLVPFIVKKTNLSENDGVIILNFRADRARMLTQKILKQKALKNLEISTMTDYGNDFKVEIAFPTIPIETVLANEISKAGLTQVHIAETEKFPHATYFLNGGKEEPHQGEEHILIPSRKDVATHDLAPQMKAEEIADEAIKKIQTGTDFIFINFANPDMVGHSGNFQAIVQAVEFVDVQLGRVVNTLIENDGIALITADHGNAEVNVDLKTGEKHTAHTTNLVPLIVTDEMIKIKDGSLADLAPTILKIFNLEKPKSMTGESLL